jgi:putative membrane protein
MFRFEHGPDFFWGLIPLLGTIFWIALLGLLIWALLHWLTRRNPPFIGYPPPPPLYHPTAMEILRQRYARGEIDDATFQQMRERLEASMPPGQQQQHP